MARISFRRSWRSRLEEPWPTVEKADGTFAEVDPDIVEILAQPAEREGALLDVIRKSGGDESIEKAAAAYARVAEAIRDAFGEGGIPPGLVKAMQAQMGTDEDEHDDEPAGPDSVLREQVAKAEPAKPKPTRSAAESWLEVARIEREGADSMAERRLDAAAAAVRKADPELTEEQSVAKALENNPELYERMRRHELRKAGLLIDGPPPLADPLQAAADRMRATDPSLSEEQAVAKALENNPHLYEGAT